jgi:fructoselysine 6-kinase
MRVTAVGDCGVDRYVNRGYDRPGGITLNFAATARRLFAQEDVVGVITAVGTDPEARLVRHAIDVLGLESCVAEREGATSIQYIDQQPSGEKIFVRYEEGVLRDYRVGAEERAIIARSDLLMAVVYSQVEGFFDSVMAAPSPGVRAVDFSDLAGVTGGVSIVDRYADRFHVGFFGLGPADGAVIDHLEALARRTGRVIVVTLGSDGSLALGGPQRLAQPAVAVPRVVDTTGAGDAFAAGFLREYWATRRIGPSLEAGARSGAEAVQRLGAFPWEGDPDHVG